MRGALKVCRRQLEGDGGLALVSMATVGAGFCIPLCMGEFWRCATVRPKAYLFHWWMLVVLLGCFVAWSVMRYRGRIDASGGYGFVLAAFGLHASWFCHLVLYGVCPTYGDKSLVEEIAQGHLRFMIAAHRWGGPLAMLVGLLVVLFGSRATAIGSACKS